MRSDQHPVRPRILAIFAIAMALPVWLAWPLPMQDVPSHEEIVALLVHGLEWSGAPERLTLDPAPRPYVVTYFIWAALASLVGVELAGRLLLTYAVVGGSLAAARLVHTLDPAKRERALLVGLFVYGEFYYLGFVPYYTSLPTAFLLLTRAAGRSEPPSRRALALDATLLLATFLIHPVSGLITAFLLAFTLSREDVRGSLARLLWVGLPCVLWTGAIELWASPRTMYPSWPLAWAPAQGLIALALSPVGQLTFWTGGALTRALAILNLLAWLLGAFALLWPHTYLDDRRRRGARRLLVLGVAWLLFFPFSLRNGAMLNSREVVYLLPLLLAWTPASASCRATRVLTGLALACVFSAACVGHVLAAREQRALDPVLAAMEPGEAAYLDGWLESEVVRGRELSMHAHALARYSSRRGGRRGPPGHLRFSTSPIRVGRPLPVAVGDEIPREYRYLVRTPDQPPDPPPGFRELDLQGETAWRLFERDGN